MRLRRRRPGFHYPRPQRRGHYRAGRFHHSDRRRHPWLRRVLLALVVVVVLLVLGGAGVWFYLRHEIGGVPKVTLSAGTLTPQRAGAPYDVLLVAVPGGDAPASLVVVARVVPAGPAGHAVELLAIPTSLRVPVARSRKGAAPEALFGGHPPTSAAGLTQLVRNVNGALHIPVSHLAEVGDAGLRAIVDRLGGVYLDFPAPLADQATGLRLDASGCQAVAGTKVQTLLASGAPYWYQGGQWQQWTGGSLAPQIELAVLAGLLVRASPSLGSLFGVRDLAGDAGGAVRLDSTWGAGALLADAGQLAGIKPSSIHAGTLPTTPKAGYRVASAATGSAITAFLSGKPVPPAGAPWLPRPCSP